MKVFVSKSIHRIRFLARGESQEVIGDLTQEIGPGQSAFGRSYDEWSKLPAGEHDVQSPSRQHASS